MIVSCVSLQSTPRSFKASQKRRAPPAEDLSSTVFEVKVARLLDQALKFHGFAAIFVGFTQVGKRLFDRFAIFSCPLLVGLGLDHPLGENGEDESKLLLAFGLPPK